MDAAVLKEGSSSMSGLEDGPGMTLQWPGKVSYRTGRVCCENDNTPAWQGRADKDRKSNDR
jgi:hypothetical protein